MRLIIAPAARRDLEDIWTYIGRESPAHADETIDRIIAAAHRFTEHPELGRLREDLAPNLRCFPEVRYLICYRVREDNIEIARVLHGARDLDAMF
ncbi:MAG: type II toxin-antitoxin system RelE/ParE family toxin [bacterium]